VRADRARFEAGLGNARHRNGGADVANPFARGVIFLLIQRQHSGLNSYQDYCCF